MGTRVVRGQAEAGKYLFGDVAEGAAPGAAAASATVRRSDPSVARQRLHRRGRHDRGARALIDSGDSPIAA